MTSESVTTTWAACDDGGVTIRSRDGAWTVEVVAYADSGEWLRVKQHRFLCKPLVRSPEELGPTFGLDLADFLEVAA